MNADESAIYVKLAKAFDVKVSGRNESDDSFSISDADMVRVYVKDKYSEFNQLVYLERVPGYKFTITGPYMDVMAAGFFLESVAGMIQVMNDDGKTSLGVRKIQGLLVPKLDKNILISLTFIESLLTTLSQQCEASDEDQGDNLMVSYSFVSLIRDYCAMQCYIPEFFKEKGIDFIGDWRKINDALFADVFNSADDIPDEMRENLIPKMYANRQEIFDNINKMKVYSEEAVTLLREKLSV